MNQERIGLTDTITEKPLFDALGPISQIVIGSTNENKVEGNSAFFRRLGIESGCGVEIVPVSRQIYGEEAEWTDARAVVDSKARELVSQMQGEEGGRSLAIVNDVVFSTIELDQESGLWVLRPQGNLSRYGDQVGSPRMQALSKDIEFYTKSGGNLVCWDSVAGFLAPPTKIHPELRVMLANRHVAILRQIPESRVNEVYSRDGLHRKINARLDLVGQEREFIEWYGFIKMKQTVNGNGFKTLDGWYDDVRWLHRSDSRFSSWGNMVYGEINNGAPFGIESRVNELLNYKPKASRVNDWTVI